MSALASATMTVRPVEASFAANVLPPLPNPMMRASAEIADGTSVLLVLVMVFSLMPAATGGGQAELPELL